jgi:hypothetical protein
MSCVMSRRATQQKQPSILHPLWTFAWSKLVIAPSTSMPVGSSLARMPHAYKLFTEHGRFSIAFWRFT